MGAWGEVQREIPLCRGCGGVPHKRSGRVGGKGYTAGGAPHTTVTGCGTAAQKS